MSMSIVIAAAAAADVKAQDLEPSPIPKSWILSGTPEARNKHLAKSYDRTSYVVIWDCTPGHFNWHYTEDEVLVVLSGEAWITNGRGEERRLGAGDMGFFPAGSTATWRVTQTVRKVAVLKRPIPRPLELGLRAWGKLLRISGLRPAAASPLATV
jgi:uncharacterized protein